MSDSKLKKSRPDDRLSIQMLKAAAVLYSRVYNNLTLYSPCLIPRSGPAILICNHTSAIDPALLQAVCQRRLITWMMAREYQDIKGAGWFFRTVGIIPVERSGRDTAPLRAAIRKLDDGGVLGIFPEGRIAPSREFLPFQTGVALMAIKTKVPVYPAYLDGSQRNKGMLQACLEPNDIHLSFGPAVEFDRSNASRENLEAAMAAMKTAMARLRDRQP